MYIIEEVILDIEFICSTISHIIHSLVLPLQCPSVLERPRFLQMHLLTCPCQTLKRARTTTCTTDWSIHKSDADHLLDRLELVVAEKYLVQVEKKNKGGQAKCIESLKRSIAESVCLVFIAIFTRF